MARYGAYGDADKAYAAAQDAPRELVLSRRLALAQVRNDLPAARALIPELTALLKTHPNLEIELRLALVEGALAYRSGQGARARQAYERAGQLADELTSPGAGLARYEVASYLYLSALPTRPAPTPAEYRTAFTAAYAPVLAAPGAYWPLDVNRSSLWGRAWVSTAADYGWTEEAVALGQAGATAMWQLYQSGGFLDQDAGYASVHLTLELAEAFPGHPSAPDWLTPVAAALETWDKAIAPYPQNTYLEQAYCWGRFHRARARQLMARGDADAAVKELDQAVSFFERARRPVDRVDALLDLPAFNSKALSPRAEANAAQAAVASEELAYPTGRFLALAYLGRLKAERGDLTGAEKDLRAAVDQLAIFLSESGATPEGKRQLLERSRWVTDALTEVLMRQHRGAEALEVVQGLGLQQSVADVDLTRVQTRDPKLSQALSQIQKTRGQDAELSADLQAARSNGDNAAVTRIQQAVAGNKAEFYRALNVLKEDRDYASLVAVRPTSFAKLQPLMPEDMLLVQYFPAGDKLYLFALTRQDLKIFTSPVTRDELDLQVREVRTQVNGGKIPAEQLATLYGELIQPVARELAPKKTLAVIPSGSLYYLPFAALSSGSKYLAEEKSVVVLTSAEILDLVAAPSGSKLTSVLALGNPDGSLPGARREVEQLAPLFAEREVYFEQDATVDRLRHAGKHQVLHLATHGVLNPRDVNESYLLLAGTENHLTTGAIYGLDLHGVALVTLSACQTAMAERAPGAEVSSLAQAFSVAGGKSMLASLWKVDDEGTARLMTEFYGELTRGTPKGEALRRAQVKLIGDPRFASPFYWASFQLIGDWR